MTPKLERIVNTATRLNAKMAKAVERKDEKEFDKMTHLFNAFIYGAFLSLEPEEFSQIKDACGLVVSVALHQMNLELIP